MRIWIFGLLLAGLPCMASAQTPWCSVPPDAAPKSLAAITQQLTPLLDSQPQPRVHIHTEGTLDHHGIRDESIEAKKQLPIMRDAALAWRAGAGEAYLALSTRYLNAWVATFEPNLNPIDETPFDTLIQTYAIIAPKMDAPSRDRAKAFLTKWAKGYIDAMDSHLVVSQSLQATSWNNNWQSHRIKLVTMMAVAVDDPALFAEARRLFRAQIEANIAADGEVHDFAERDALHYVIYDLEPLTQAALAARVRGEDWYNYQSPTGSSIARGFAWLAPYAKGDTPHEEFVHSKTPFDAQRAAAGEKGYSGPFEPKTAGNVYWAASVFEPGYLSLAQKLKPVPPAYLALCGA